MKVVLDTNVLISILFGKTLKNLKEELKEGKLSILISAELISELIRVLERPKFRMLNEEDKRDLFVILERIAVIVSPSGEIQACRDKKDNIVLECALEGRADYIITGDKDLLVLNPFKGMQILSPKAFEKILGGK